MNETPTDDAKQDPWIRLVQTCYDESTNYMDNNFRDTWEDNIRHFQSRHASGSKYHHSNYKHRSKIFRPKTRSSVRGNEAAAVQAFFSNMDVVSIEAVDSDNQAQVASAAVHKELVNLRLTRPFQIPWFKLIVGAFQTGQVIGPICSCQEWLLDEEREIDRPDIRLVPIENLRISPSADWLDPVNSSPYLIEIMPMYWDDVKAKMKSGEWQKHDKGEVARVSRAIDTTESARRKEQEDPRQYEDQNELTTFSTVWVYKNIIRRGGKDYIFYTVGTQLKLTDPQPLKEVVLHGRRPYVIGLTVIEAHQTFPDSPVRLGFPIQQETNEVANQRGDNVKLVLNKRWKVKRGSQVDIKQLVRNVPGGVILTNEPTQDVVGEEFNDITGSAYAEQDRLNMDFDELMGAFSTSTVQANRKLNETVGGMEMMRGAANSVTEYQIRTFAETWVEPVINQLIWLEQYYETDEHLMAVAASRARLFQKYNIDRVTDWLLNQDFTLTINVGAGATDPMSKIQRLLMAIRTLSQIMQNPLPGLRMDEITKEVFAALGWKDGKRFVEVMDGSSPVTQQMQQMIQAMQQEIGNLQKQLKDKQDGIKAKLIQTEMKERGETDRLRMELGAELDQTRLKEAAETGRTDKEIAADILTTQLKGEVDIAKANISGRGRDAGRVSLWNR